MKHFTVYLLVIFSVFFLTACTNKQVSVEQQVEAEETAVENTEELSTESRSAETTNYESEIEIFLSNEQLMYKMIDTQKIANCKKIPDKSMQQNCEYVIQYNQDAVDSN